MRQLRSIALVPVLASLLFIHIGGCASRQERPTRARIHESWEGEVTLDLRKQAPDWGFITDAESWETLWKAYRGDEKVPQVDFKEHLILVRVNRDPNHLTPSTAEIDGKGNLKVEYIQTLIGFKDPKTCAYLFSKIDRYGIRSINGKRLKTDQ